MATSQQRSPTLKSTHRNCTRWSKAGTTMITIILTASHNSSKPRMKAIFNPTIPSDHKALSTVRFRPFPWVNKRWALSRKVFRIGKERRLRRRSKKTWRTKKVKIMMITYLEIELSRNKPKKKLIRRWRSIQSIIVWGPITGMLAQARVSWGWKGNCWSMRRGNSTKSMKIER